MYGKKLAALTPAYNRLINVVFSGSVPSHRSPNHIIDGSVSFLPAYLSCDAQQRVCPRRGVIEFW